MRVAGALLALLAAGGAWVLVANNAPASVAAANPARGTPAPGAEQTAPAAPAPVIETAPGMPPVIDPQNLYSETVAGRIDPRIAGDPARIYVPNLRSNEVIVYDPVTLRQVDRFKVGHGPQHIVPSWDLRTLWVANNAERRNDGSLTPIDPRTGKPGKAIAVDDPYNLYFTPDGRSAIVVAEARRRLDFRDPHTMALQYSIDTPRCGGINHADFAIDGRSAIFTCEFDGSIVRIDLMQRRVLGYLKLEMPRTRLKETKVPLPPEDPNALEICTTTRGMPQDIRISPDGQRYYVADMEADGVHVVDGATFRKIGFIATGLGAHGLYPSRDGRSLYVVNRGSHRVHNAPGGQGSITVLDFATGAIKARWPIPGGGSPDMGNVSADGSTLWVSGRFDDVIYRIDTRTGQVSTARAGLEPHGLTVWPQPGRYSVGHTGNLR
jgi:DNA-binding beta-propeller fold protein YncE